MTIVVVGVLLPFIPMDARIRQLVVAIIAILALLWVLALLFGAVRVPHVDVR